MSEDRKWARLLRLGIITQTYKCGDLTKEDAIECLKANLNPADSSTFVDDSNLFEKSFEEAVRIISESEK